MCPHFFPLPEVDGPCHSVGVPSTRKSLSSSETSNPGRGSGGRVSTSSGVRTPTEVGGLGGNTGGHYGRDTLFGCGVRWENGNVTEWDGRLRFTMVGVEMWWESGRMVVRFERVVVSWEGSPGREGWSWGPLGYGSALSHEVGHPGEGRVSCDKGWVFFLVFHT